MSERTSQTVCSRRAFLRTGTGAAATAAAAAGPAAAQGNETDGNQTEGSNETGGNQTGGNQTGGNQTDGGDGGGAGQYDFGGYLDDANLFDGSVEDMTGQDEVTVAVGAGDTGFAFDPPAIHVDPGTTVVWEWTGKGGAHNVVANSGEFESGDPQESGTYDYTFEDEATYTYYCDPHEGAGMKGAVVVGEGGTPGGDGGGTQTAANDLALQTLLAFIVLGLLSPIVFLLFVRRKLTGPPRE